MKRDMDLARKILLEIEKAPEAGNRIDINIEGYTEDAIEDSLLLLEEAGLVTLDEIYINEDYHKPTELTLEGQKFLDAARDNGIWEKAKGRMSQVGAFGLDILKQILIELTKAQLHLP